MGDCKGCSGSCGGCGKVLQLSRGEIDLLRALGQYSFLPVARKADDMTPIYREETDYTEEEYSLSIQLLEKKSLIYLDYTPLKGANMEQYPEYPVHGSMALTARGQQVLDLLELQGVDN
jgi:hypothetical protein